MGAILGFLATGLNGLIVIAVTACLSFIGGGYLGYNYEKNYYEAKINTEKVASFEAIQREQAKGAALVARYIDQIRIEHEKNTAYQNQIRVLFSGVHGGITTPNCHVPYGFIRLHNAAASGQATEPASTDAITSEVDIATVLSTIAQNYGKYREAAEQIEAAHAAAQ